MKAFGITGVILVFVATLSFWALKVHYNALRAADSKQLKTLFLAGIDLFSGGGPPSRIIKLEEERPEAVKELSKHPIQLKGIVMYGDDVIYVVQGASYESSSQTNNIADAFDCSNLNDPMVLNCKSGQCFLLSKKAYTANQNINCLVYRCTKSVSLDGKNYPCYSDDPNLAYSVTESW